LMIDVKDVDFKMLATMACRNVFRRDAWVVNVVADGIRPYLQYYDEQALFSLASEIQRELDGKECENNFFCKTCGNHDAREAWESFLNDITGNKG